MWFLHAGNARTNHRAPDDVIDVVVALYSAGATLARERERTFFLLLLIKTPYITKNITLYGTISTDLRFPTLVSGATLL